MNSFGDESYFPDLNKFVVADGINKQIIEWKNTGEMVDSAIKSISSERSKNIKIQNNTGDLEIYTDQMFEKVFYNLIENAITHGKRLTEIKIYYVETKPEKECKLIIENDGIGIPEKNKEKIFEKKFGRYTGLGLFLVKEILDINQMKIKETGKEDTGATFEIIISGDKYRIDQEKVQKY